MRQAVVVAPLGFTLPTQGSVFAAAEPVGPLCAALTRGGQRIVMTRTTSELETDFERALAGIGPGDDLLVYLAVMTTTHADSVGVLLDDDRSTLGLRVLSDTVLVREPASVLFVIEACHDGDPDDPMLAAEHVEAIGRALDARARGYGALVGARAAAGATPGAWPFTRHLLYSLTEQESHDDRGAAPMSLVYERMCSARPEDARVQSFAFVRGRTDFVFAEPPDVLKVAASMRAGPASAPPSAPASAPSSQPGSSQAMRPMQPSLPPMEPLLDLADAARARGAWEEALAAYKAALMVAPQSGADDGLRATIYARIGDVKRAQDKPREAELNYEKALDADARHRAALDALVELATEAKDVRRGIDWRRKRLPVIEGAGARVAELLEIARAQHAALGDPRAAAETLEEARKVDPRDRAVAEALRDAYEKLHRWPRVVDVLAEIAELTTDPAERAAVRFAAADVALARLREEERGLGLLDRALDDDPTHDKALHALVAVRTGRSEWEPLDAAYTRLVDRFAKLGDAERAWDVCRKLGALRRDKTRDVIGSIEAFTGAVSCKPSDVDSRAMLADMHLARGDEAQAVAEFERVAQDAPLRASTYTRLFALHQRAGRDDRAWLAATALEELAAADVDQQLVADQFRPEGPIRPSRSLDDAGWDEVLRAPGADDVVAEVLRAIVDAATTARIDELRSDRKLFALDPARMQSATSTVTAVRSFQWAAQVLGVDAPELYVLDEVPGGIAAVPAPRPATALGPEVLQGLSPKDLAFLAGRHLTYYRREHYALVCYPTLPELSALFLGAVKLAMPDLPVPEHLSDAVARRRKTLAKHADDTQKKALRAAVERLDARGGRVDLAAWIKSVELSAQRAGLLLCGDLKVAMTRMRAETRAIAELGLEQRRADLLAFCASDKLGRARWLVGVDARTSQAPPASQRQVG
jgi:tetratricopeptide (TPR) repeat protein